MGRLYGQPWEQCDVAAFASGIKGDGVISGLAVSEKGTPDMGVQVTAGSCYIDDTIYTEASTTNLVIDNGHATHDRKDLITYDATAGNPAVVKGTAATPPIPPSIPSGDILLAIVLVDATESTSILNADIMEGRVLIIAPTYGLDDLYVRNCAKIYGWFTGGLAPILTVAINRLTLSNDTTDAIYRCDLSQAVRYHTGFANNLYGWSIGGALNPAIPTARMDRITLADDTTNAIARGDISHARYHLTGFTDMIYGWLGGGAGNSDIIDRMVLADDTTTAVDRCNLSSGRGELAGFTDLSYGWFGGGAGYSNIVDRITLADDTTNAIDRCNISVGRQRLVVLTDHVYGWFIAGEYAAAGYSSRIDRIVLANDTTNAVDRADLITPKYSLAGFTDDIYGWLGGGMDGAGNKDTVERFTLANDTVNAVDRCDLPSVARGQAAFTGA